MEIKDIKLRQDIRSDRYITHMWGHYFIFYIWGSPEGKDTPRWEVEYYNKDIKEKIGHFHIDNYQGVQLAVNNTIHSTFKSDRSVKLYSAKNPENIKLIDEFFNFNDNVFYAMYSLSEQYARYCQIKDLKKKFGRTL